MQTDRLQILEKAPIRKAVVTLALPTMMGMIVQALYNLADTFFIGRLNDANAVAAVTLAFPLFMTLQAFGNLFATGGASYISRALGKKELENPKRAAATSFFLAVGTGIVMAAVFLLNIKRILTLIGAAGDTFRLTQIYLSYIMAFAPVLLLQVSLSGILRAEGATTEAMIGMMTGTVINILLDPIFILTLNLGVRGAAIATIIGNSFGVLYYITYFVRKKSVVSISPAYFSFHRGIIIDICKIGIPVAVNQILMSVVHTFSNAVAASYGDTVIAAMGIVMRTSSLAFMLIHGLALGYQPLAGYCFGAKLFGRLKEGFKFTITIGTVLSALFTAVGLTLAPQIIRAFIDNSEIIALGARVLRLFAVPGLFMSVQITIMVSFQAMGKGLESMILSLGRQGLFFVPSILILNTFFGLNGFIFAHPVSDFLSIFLSVAMFARLLRTLHKQQGQAQ